MRKSLLIIILVVSMLFAPAASASLLDDVNNGINNAVHSVKLYALSIPGVTSQTVTCNNGAKCGLSGQDWVVNMNTMSTSQILDLTLPASTTAITADGSYKVTTQGTVTIEVTQEDPIQTIPVIKQTVLQYPIESLTGASWYTVDAYSRAGSSSTITTRYGIQLLSATGNSQVIHESYDYRNPQTVRLSDNSGHTAIIQPSHQNNGGFVNDAAATIYVNNGYGTYEAYDANSFSSVLTAVISAYRYKLDYWNTPQNWAGVMTLVKAKGAVQFSDMPFVIQGNNVVYTFPTTSIGTELQAIIPQTMASSISVRVNWGQPRIDSYTLTPATIQLGQGLQTLTVKATNVGSDDRISVAVIVNGDTVTCGVCSLQLGANQQGTFIFSLNPIMTIADGATANANLHIVATAGGSGLDATKDVTQIVQGKPKQDCTWYGTCAATTQKISVTVYQADGVSVLSNAPIFYNTNQQVASGTWSGNLPFGTYVFSSNNASNPSMFAPSPVTVTLASGQPPAIVGLHFTNKPPVAPGSDYTWIFWVLVGLVVTFIGSHFVPMLKHPVNMIIAGVVLGLIIWQVFNFIVNVQAAYDAAVANPWNPLHYL